MVKATTKVLVVDDSALIRQLLSKIIERDDSLEVVGTASNPHIAREKIKKLNPDVLTLDVEMPGMDGITFLEKLMRLHPMPVVMVSSLTKEGADVTREAIALGAVDYISKPESGIAEGLDNYSDEIITKIKTAARKRVTAKRAPQKRQTPVEGRLSADAVLPKKGAKECRFVPTETIVALGASTGGTEAIRDVVSRLPADAPAIVITQHMPANFTKAFAERVNAASKMTVCQAEDGQPILAGHVYIAPGDRHLIVKRTGVKYRCELCDGPPVNRHKPAVDVMFRSVAQNAGRNAIGVLLTGMGDDGARGLKELQETGAYTIAQDESTSVVWGMPGAASKMGAVDKELPLDRIAASIVAKTKSAS